MKLSIIIPAHNEARYIGACLESVLKAEPKCIHEIIVVDNASTDTTSAIASKFSGVRVVYEKEKGLTKARQKGFEEATGDILAYVDADTNLPPLWPATVVAEFTKNRELVCLSGPYRYIDIPNWQNVLVKMYWICAALPVYWLVGYMAVGGNFAVQRKGLERIGGFDKGISFYGEDTDIARRLHEVGKVKFKPSFFMYTSGRRLNGQGFWKTGFVYSVNFFSEVLLKKPATKEYEDIR